MFKKPGTKLKLNVNTRDGGKVNAKATLEVNILPYENIGLRFEGADGSSYDPETALKDGIQYTGGGNQMYKLYLQHKHMPEVDWDNWGYDEYYKNVKVTVKGGKLISYKDWAKTETSYIGQAVVVTSADGKATVTLVDNANNKKKIEYQITNTAADSGKAKAPSIKLYAPKKISNESLWNEDEDRFDSIVYQVTDKDKANYAGGYVRITPDYTVANNNAEYLANEWGDIAVSKVDENGRFEVWFEENLSNNLGHYYDYKLPDGTYKMVATVGAMVRGEFKPLAKDVKLNFSIPKPKKTNTNMTVTAKYTLDAKSSSKADIAVKTDTRYVVSDAMNVIKSAKDQGQTKDTHTNEFTKYFVVEEADWDDDGNPTRYTIGLKNTLSADEIAYITGDTDDRELQKKAKEDCTGYITVSNGYYDYYGRFRAYNTKDIKVTITFKETKYSVTGASVFAPKDNQPTTVNVTLMNGKKPVNVIAAALDGADTKSFAASAAAETDGTIKITSSATVEAKKHDVMLKVIPEDSGYIKSRTWDGQKYVTTYVNKDATATYTEAEAIENFGVKVTAKIDVKAAGVKKVLKIDSKKLKIVLNADVYDQGETGHMGAYEVYVPYSFIAGNTEISKAEGSVKLDVDSKSKKTLNEIAGKEDGKDLIEVAAYDGNDRIETEDGEPLIRIRVNKAVLDKQYEKTEANKKAAASAKVPVVTTYGAKLSVPVVFTYTNNGTTTETVKFNLTMPKKPLSFDEIKDILTGTTKVGTGKNARDIKAEIESLRTPQDNRSHVILNGLLYKVWDKANGVIPKDSDVALTPDWSDLDWEYDRVARANLNDGKTPSDDTGSREALYDDIMNAGVAKVNMTITNKLAAGEGATAKLTYNFDADHLGVKHTMNSEDEPIESGIYDAIYGYCYGDDFKPTNDLTPDGLLAAIWKLDGVKEYSSDRDSVNIWIEGWDLKEATERKAGSLEFTVKINGDEYEVSYYGTIERLSNLGDVQSKFGEAFTEAGIKDIVIGCGGDEKAVKSEILSVADKALGNKNLTVRYAQVKKPAATDSTSEEMVDDFTYTREGNTITVGCVLQVTSGTTQRKVTYTVGGFEITLSHEDKIDMLVYTYMENMSGVDGIGGVAYDKESKTFTVLTDNKDQLVVDAFEKWADDTENGKELKDKIVKSLTTEFVEDWKNVTSITVEATLEVTELKETGSKTRTKTVEKRPGESIEAFANRYYDEMVANRQDYVDRLEKELEDRGIDNFTYGWLLDKKATGRTTVIVNYNDNSQESVDYTVNLQKAAE